MSLIANMNRAIRRRGAFWGVGMTVLALIVITPEGVIGLLAGDFTGRLWWSALVGAFMVLLLLLEGFEVGRHTPHRRQVNDIIVRGVVTEVCSAQSCPQVSEPNDSVRQSATGIFYRMIDAPSREVAFHNWGWYYFSVLAIGQSLVAIAIASIGFRFVTERPSLRLLALRA